MKEPFLNSNKPIQNTREIGNVFEEIAVSYLAKHGLRIIDRNFTTKFAEIDIIAKDNEILCFIEVRSRREGSFGAPYMTVDVRKQTKIVRAATAYLQRFYKKQPFCRFDIVSICGSRDQPHIEYFKNAFSADVAQSSKRGSPWQAY